ncbi:DUF2513 domain-containing protein [Cronbergia sp. UHCC 0137]|uniref:DUF2513 domain-containing protein n=1 Tax=Cronbergia sp. UHCC 0137 TaxID=3110239 RepID=UPI002B1F057A|nr:DUF2513 domain-containing protein [Cronbergia sp. UHCC 0137]MEA5620826.1 DUF2513 domain-containing protein [Cronbergia sp. UHCC 0137]
MKRDMDLIRQILFQIESHESGYAPNNIIVDGYTNEQIGYHIFIMIEGGLVKGIDVSSTHSSSPQAIVRRLTFSGHEFIDAARSESVWKKAKNLLEAQGSSINTVTMGVLTQLLSSIIKQQLGLS